MLSISISSYMCVNYSYVSPRLFRPLSKTMPADSRPKPSPSVRSYLKEKRSAAAKQATYAAIKLFTADNWLLAGCRFTCRCGRGMSCRTTQIVMISSKSGRNDVGTKYGADWSTGGDCKVQQPKASNCTLNPKSRRRKKTRTSHLDSIQIPSRDAWPMLPTVVARLGPSKAVASCSPA